MATEGHHENGVPSWLKTIGYVVLGLVAVLYLIVPMVKELVSTFRYDSYNITAPPEAGARPPVSSAPVPTGPQSSAAMCNRAWDARDGYHVETWMPDGACREYTFQYPRAAAGYEPFRCLLATKQPDRIGDAWCYRRP